VNLPFFKLLRYSRIFKCHLKWSLADNIVVIYKYRCYKYLVNVLVNKITLLKRDNSASSQLNSSEQCRCSFLLLSFQIFTPCQVNIFSSYFSRYVALNYLSTVELSTSSKLKLSQHYRCHFDLLLFQNLISCEVNILSSYYSYCVDLNYPSPVKHSKFTYTSL